jgi:hypothetical protein
MKTGKKRNRMKLWIRVHDGLEFRRLFALGAMSLAATFSSEAQFSVTLSSVQDLGGVSFDNGQPINYIYDFTISGSYPSNPDYNLYGISLCLSGFGYPGAIDGGFSASHVGGWLPTNPPEIQGDSVSFEDYYSGGPVQGTITVVSTGSLQDYFNWSVGELGWVYPDGFPDYYTTLESYSGGVAVPEPSQTGFLFSAGVIAVAAAAGFASMSKATMGRS